MKKNEERAEIEHTLMNHNKIRHLMTQEIASIISGFMIEPQKVRRNCAGCGTVCKVKMQQNWTKLAYNNSTWVCPRKKIVIKEPKFGDNNQYKVLCKTCRVSHTCKSCEQVIWSKEQGYIKCDVLHSEHGLCNECCARYFKKIEQETGVLYTEEARKNMIVCPRCFYKDNVSSRQRASYLYGKMAASAMSRMEQRYSASNMGTSSMATSKMDGTQMNSMMMGSPRSSMNMGSPRSSMCKGSDSKMSISTMITAIPDIR